jgi:outer membrane protein OmpA-like peptidoglycan-associated protein
MKSQIVRKKAGLNSAQTNTVLQYFEVQPDDKSKYKYICDVDYVVKQIVGKKESFYVNRGGEEIDVFVNHKPEDGEEFVQTKKDETSKDNLWSLPGFEFSEDDYVRRGNPEAKNEIEYREKPYEIKNLIPYLLSALALGLLLPIIYCWLTGGCFCKPCPPCPPVIVLTPNCDSCKAVAPCPDYRIVVALDKVVHFKNNEVNFDNLTGENYEKTLEECVNLYKKDMKNFYVELIGYADSNGGLDYNEVLASERVLKVANYFIKKGVHQGQFLNQKEFGNTYARKTTDPKIQAQDRKVEIRIYGLEKK